MIMGIGTLCLSKTACQVTARKARTCVGVRSTSMARCCTCVGSRNGRRARIRSLATSCERSAVQRESLPSPFVFVKLKKKALPKQVGPVWMEASRAGGNGNKIDRFHETQRHLPRGDGTLVLGSGSKVRSDHDYCKLREPQACGGMRSQGLRATEIVNRDSLPWRSETLPQSPNPRKRVGPR